MLGIVMYIKKYGVLKTHVDSKTFFLKTLSFNKFLKRIFNFILQMIETLVT